MGKLRCPSSLHTEEEIYCEFPMAGINKSIPIAVDNNPLQRLHIEQVKHVLIHYFYPKDTTSSAVLRFLTQYDKKHVEPNDFVTQNP